MNGNLHLIDTHAHLFWDSFTDDFEEVIQNAAIQGVKTFINVGVDIELSRKAAQQAQEFNIIYKDQGLRMFSTIAIHPENGIHYFQNEAEIQINIDALEEIYNQYKDVVVAVGECGLDYAYFKHEGFLPAGCSADDAKQLEQLLFQSQIDLARKLELPLILHIRDDRSENPELIDCWDKALEMTTGHYGILHCYSGLPATTQKAMNLNNWLVSFAGNITYKNNQYLRDAIITIPLEKICLETDCPFLPPQSIRGKRNEPASVNEIATLIAELKGVTLNEVAEKTSKSVQDLLKLDDK